MADETVINGEFSDAQTLKNSGDETSSKILSLTQRIKDLQLENDKIVGEDKGYKQRIEELTASIEELNSQNLNLKKQVDKAEVENKALSAVAARAAELEGEVSRLQHDLISSMSDLQDSTAELSGLKRDMEGLKEKDKEKDIKLEAIEKERDLLLVKVEKLNGVEISLRDELEAKEKEIRVLKKSIQELETAVASSKSLEKLKNDLEKTIEKMKGDMSILESSLEKKEKVISEFELKERSVVDGVNGVSVTEGGKKGLVGDLKQRDWLVIGGSGAAIAAVAVMGLTCYLRTTNKH